MNRREPLRILPRRGLVQAYTVGIAGIWLGVLVVLLQRNQWHLGTPLVTIAAWTATLAIASIPSVGEPTPAYLTSDTPIVVAASLLLSPVACAFIALAGTCDAREFRRAVRWEQALFNRAQVSVVAGAQSWLVHLLVPYHLHSSLIFPIALLALVAGTAINYVLVGAALCIYYGFSFIESIGKLRIGTPFDYLVTLATWGIFGAMFAALYDLVSVSALPFFVLPILLGRQALVKSQRSAQTQLAYEERVGAVQEIARKVQDERADERKLIAADLHDEALQSLYYVDVMANIVKRDLSDGRLFDLERDVRDLLTATRDAAESLRSRIGNLRESSLGSGGLRQALNYLVERSQTVTSARLSVNLSDLAADASTELLTYQIAKESLANAMTHSGATQIELTCQQDAARLYLIVQDNGRGFDSPTVRGRHYGLSIMRERAQAGGGELYIDSEPGHGTKVTFHVSRFASGQIKGA